MALPLATFAYIGVELLTVTAFEARDPHELKLPARNIAWFTVVLYCISTGLIVSNISWKNQNLPTLFGQALTLVIRGGPNNDEYWLPALAEARQIHAAPILVLYRAGFKFLPAFLNGCLIYSALSCANTALYVAARQLYGMTRSITVTAHSGPLRNEWCRIPDAISLARLDCQCGGLVLAAIHQAS
jgi:yeast amino acid transporter